jgi:hypothetical protein
MIFGNSDHCLLLPYTYTQPGHLSSRQNILLAQAILNVVKQKCLALFSSSMAKIPLIYHEKLFLGSQNERVN